jgi:hypothetical protein
MSFPLIFIPLLFDSLISTAPPGHSQKETACLEEAAAAVKSLMARTRFLCTLPHYHGNFKLYINIAK